MDRFIVRRRDTDEYVCLTDNFISFNCPINSKDINDALIFDEDDSRLQCYRNSPDKFLVYKIEKEDF